jgi:hypothetical protein
LDFDYDDELKVDTWEGIQAFHDFEIHDNGDMTAWKSYGIGPGNRFDKTMLDKLYKKPPQPNSGESTTQQFPQGSTGATFMAGISKEETMFEPKLEVSNRR